MTDKDLNEIIENCLKNDRRAQARLYELCFDGLMKICIRYFSQREDAVAVLNQGFLKILLNLKDFDRERNFENWSFSIAIRTCIDEYRKQRKFNELHSSVESYQEIEPEFKPVYNDIIDELSQAEVDRMLSFLSDEEKFVFNLFEFEGYSHQEIAQKLGVSERSSKRYLQRAKDKLKEELEKKIRTKTNA